MIPTDPPQPAAHAAAGDPCTIVIFGAGGDMTKRLMVPALYNLARTGVLPQEFAIVGVDLAPGTAADWCNSLHAMLASFVGDDHAEFRIDRIDEAVWQRLAERMTYLQGDITKPELYADITAALDTARMKHATQDNAIFYLAVAGSFFATVVAQLAAAKLTEDAGTGHWRRVVVEKPFGHSLASAQALNRDILCSLREDQIFRIDHFLGKDTVQSIMALRFANGLFEPIWNRDRIDHVQITVAETVGVETRGKFYEATGALRDMVPNHVFTLLAMVTMEPPTGFDAASIRSRKADVFAAMATARPDQSVRGQYAAGTVRGHPVDAYRHDADVAVGSNVETYVAMELAIDNWRWAGVPFYFRTGKHLSARNTEIAIRFKQAPFAAFRDTPVASLRPNWLVLSIAPDESISLQFEVKRPGPVVDLAAVRMDFQYADWFPKEPNVGYETLIRDVMIGDQTLFMRADMVEQGWRIVQPVLDAWAADPEGPANYASGSDGPAAAGALLARSGRDWRPIDGPR
jgi:glucose-6-phosphate 1-dehydrogenase